MKFQQKNTTTNTHVKEKNYENKLKFHFSHSAVFKQNNNTLLSRYAICVRHVKPKRNALNLVTTFFLKCTLVTFVHSKYSKLILKTG